MKLTERKRYHKIEKDSSRKEQKNGTTEEEKAGCCLWTGSSCIDFLEFDAKYSGSAKIKSGMYRGELTFGTAVEEREDNCYPVQLQKYMEQAEKKYRIGNFGVEGAAVQKKSKKPYTKEERYESSTEYKADLVVMMLGTNDTTEENWTDIDTFQKDYQSLIKGYQDLKSSPEIWLVTPPMIQSDGSTEMEERAKRVEEIKNAIETIGEKNKLTVLDLYSYSQKHPEWYQEDGVRLNKDGALAVADMVGDCIINKTK